MATTADYLTQLQVDKQTLVDNLVAKGVEASNDETFTTLAPKVADIQSGGIEITDASYLFYNNARLDMIDEWLALINENCKTCRYMFYQCASLKTIPKFNTSGVNDFSYIFQNCSGLTAIPELNTSNGTNFNSMLQSCSNLTTIPEFDTSNGTDFSAMFRSCSSLTTIPEFDTSNGTNLQQLFRGCNKLISVPLLDCSSVVQILNVLANASNVTTLGGFKDLGKAYITTASTSNSNYKLDLSNCALLTHDSLMNVINNLYDIASLGVKSQDLVIATECQELLSDDEVLVATNKGWNVSFA